MDAVTKVPFYGNELIVVEKNGQQMVAMKPIVEALGLDWGKQQELIKRDPVLSSTATVTGVVAKDGKVREMICLPLEFLNGWLFKVPASRYTGEKREIIGKYQRECYKVLSQYFHAGGAISPNADGQQLNGLATQLAAAISASLGNQLVEMTGELMKKDLELTHEKRQTRLLSNFAPKTAPMEISKVTGRPRDRFVSGYYTSNRSGRPVESLMQAEFNF